MHNTNPNENNTETLPPSDRAADEAAATDSGFMHRMGVALDGAYRVGVIETASFFGLAVDAVNNAPKIINILPGDQGVGAFSDDPFLGSDYIRRNLTAGYEGYNDTIGYTPPEATDTVDSILYHGTGFLTGAALTGGGASLASRTSYADDLLRSGDNAASPGLLSRSFNYMSPNGARAVYISDAPAAERLSLLASRGEEARPYMENIVRDIRAGRTNITSDAIDGLRNGGRMPDSVMEGLDTAQGMLRANGSMGGAWRYSLSPSNLGDTVRSTLPNVPTLSASGAFSTAASGAALPLNMGRYALTHPVRGTAVVGGAIAADNYVLDGAVRDGYGDLYGLGMRGVSDGVELAFGDNHLSNGFDLAAAGVDGDQTISGTLRDQERHGLAFAAERTLGGGKHTPIDAEENAETAVAVADGPDGEVVHASATGPAARNGDGESSIMGFFNDAAENMGIDFNNMDGVNYAQLALAGLAAYTTLIEGNPMGGVIMGAMAYGLRPAMKFLDDLAESQGIDLVPDQWHTPESTNAYGGLSL